MLLSLVSSDITFIGIFVTDHPVMALNKTAEKQKLNENYEQSLPIRQNLFVAE